MNVAVYGLSVKNITMQDIAKANRLLILIIITTIYMVP